ncbi:MAG: orotate phosphoribosyltransferase [Legionellales bacterium RIFCSPHIGHO2_12_FULL_37_14]|nr:MAG: orotate phosphoribosyltransferase [Legionellales bacterium RIFCSPHIGHO2_12_FULL_37_14]
MKKIQEKFIEFAIEHRVLQFGKFTLKSGRISPYFFNAGIFNDGIALKTLGNAYANLYKSNHLTTPHLFGPAYKGIILASITSVMLALKGINTTVTFNRKEEKIHGEGGVLIGKAVKGKTTIIDDVITAGTAFRHAKDLIEREGGKVDSVLIALNRCERGVSSQSSIQEIQNFGIKVFAIISLFDIAAYLKDHGQEENASRLLDYQSTYAPS